MVGDITEEKVEPRYAKCTAASQLSNCFSLPQPSSIKRQKSEIARHQHVDSGKQNPTKCSEKRIRKSHILGENKWNI